MKRNFLWNLITLTLCALAIRLLSLRFNQVLQGALGGAGMGMLELILSVRGFGITFSSAGVSLAAARLTATELGRGSGAGARAAVRCCLGTYGQRLGDIRHLRWDQFDWGQRVVHMTTGKTGRVMHQPMLEGFFQWAQARYAWAQAQGGEAAVWVLPRLRVHSNPSQEFTQLMRMHGIGVQNGGGQGKRRVWHSKTFHCLRATVATMLHACGVSQGMAMELVGHESAEVHAVYIRPTQEQLRQVVHALPEV